MQTRKLERAAGAMLAAMLWGCSAPTPVVPEATTGATPCAKVDTRPYEFVNAARTTDEFPPWIDFETETGWFGEAQPGDPAPRVARSQVHQLFGDWTLAVALRTTNDFARPARPLPLPSADFDFMGVWLRGTGQKYGAREGDRPKCSAVFRLADGTRRTICLTDANWPGVVNWGEWHYVVKRFSAPDLAALRRPGACFDGFLLSGSTNYVNETYYFDNVGFFRESTAKLAFKPRAKRNLAPLAGAVLGNNVGAGTLPFPTREDGALPASSAPGARNAVVTNGNEVTLSYAGPDGRLVYRWPLGAEPDAIVARWNDEAPFHPMRGAGVKGAAGRYALAIRGKTLVVDVFAPPGATAVAFGRSDRAVRRFPVPMYFDGWGANRSQIELTGSVFSHAFADWYRSNASAIGSFKPKDGSPACRAATYRAKTDGTRNPVSERVYVTVSPEFAEVLPVIANPASPWKRLTGTRAWNSFGSTADRARDKRFWRRLWRYGVREMIITDHEVCFRDGGESFTFRLDAAPEKGGDAGLRDWTDFLQKELGYVYGPYNNFTDFAPINANWRIDRVARQSDGALVPAWMRCYSPKSGYALEACEWHAPRLKEKFGFGTAYCDVHTAVFPWARTDYDARVPGAATFAQTFYDYGEILLAQRKAWNGPVYSEGTCQYLYAGLTDGNYAQPRMDAAKDPWIVDFNLLRIHPLECDFGMGNLAMFAPAKDTAARRARADWFMAAELAFGNAPYLMTEQFWDKDSSHGFCYAGEMKRPFAEGLPAVLNSYFMALPLAKRYTLAAATRIRYADAAGNLLGTSDAIRRDVAKRNQIVVEYSDGTVVAANGSRTARMNVRVDGRALALPPTGYAGWTKDGAVEALASDAGGARTDYCASPESIYLNTRTAGARTFAKARGEGVAVCRREKDGGWELIPVTGAGVAFAVPGRAATALAEDGRALGSAKLVREGAFASVVPVPGAFSYRIAP